MVNIDLISSTGSGYLEDDFLQIKELVDGMDTEDISNNNHDSGKRH